MNFKNIAVAVIGLTLGITLAAPARAFCTNGRSWTGPVNVYMVTSGTGQVSDSGLSTSQVGNYLRAAMEEINQASGMNIELDYAGDVSDPNHGAGGITLYTSSCTSQICGNNWIGCTWDKSSGDTRVALRPSACNSYDLSPDGTSPDFQGMLAHELMHALGLNHSNLDMSCSNGSANATSGVMRSFATRNTMFRYLRRDDIEGLRSKYGTRNRTIRALKSSDGSTWGSEQTYSFMPTTRTKVSGTSSRHSNDKFMALTYADASDRVRGRYKNWDGWLSADYTPDTSSNGKTWDAPAIAQAYQTGTGTQQKVLYAWWSDESTTSYSVRLRWAIHDKSSNTWIRKDGPTTSAKALGAGYNYSRNVFLVTYMAASTNNGPTNSRVITIDPNTGNQVADTSTSRLHHDFSGTACRTSSECLTAMASTGANGPCLGWTTGSVSSSDVWSYASQRVNCYFSDGYNSITLDGRSSNSSYVGAFNQAGAWGFVYRLSSATANPSNVTSVYSDFGPVGMGNLTKNNSIAFYALYGR